MKSENGFYIWTKTEYEFVSGNFHTSELECHCTYPECVEQRVSVDLVNRLEKVRAELGAPITVNRAYSCLAHQADLVAGGAQAADPQKSQHPKGNAADIKAAHMSTLVPIVEKYFKAVGLAPSWLHCDCRDDKERRWSYKA